MSIACKVFLVYVLSDGKRKDNIAAIRRAGKVIRACSWLHLIFPASLYVMYQQAHVFVCMARVQILCELAITYGGGHQANEKARNANGSVKCNASKKISSTLNIFCLQMFSFLFHLFIFFLFCFAYIHVRLIYVFLCYLCQFPLSQLRCFFFKIRLNSFPLTQISGRGLKVMKTSSKSHLNRIFKSLTKINMS